MNKMAKPEDLKVGDFVSWNSSGGRARGKITKKITNGAVPDIDVKVEGTKDNPAYQIRVYRDNEPTDTLVGHKASALTKIDPIESKNFIGLRNEDRLNEVYSKYRNTVNMSASELESWAETECSKKASISRAPIKRNLELLRTKKADWTSKHIRWANRTISFVNRMKGAEQGQPAAEGCPSKRDISLKNWAYNPDKGSNKSMKNIDKILEKVDEQGEAIDQLRSSIQELSSSEVSKGIKGIETKEAEVNSSIKTHIGQPDNEQLSQIIKLTGVESTADQWIVAGVHASNNLLDCSDRRWALNILAGMGLSFIGRPLIVNHSWDDVEASRGFVISSALVKDDASIVPESMLSGAGAEVYNKEIIEKEGLVWLYLCVAIPRSSAAAEMVLTRTANDVSTGSTHHNPYLRCPNCERSSNGKEVRMDTYTKDSRGNKIFDCDHLAGSSFLKKVLGEEYQNYNFSDYTILSAESTTSIELSLCQAGCLPAASILRPE
jgi:hypothetical protein